MKIAIEFKHKLNKPDFNVLGDLLGYYDKYEYNASFSVLESKINAAHEAYIDSLKEITDNAKKDVADNFQRNELLIETGKETYYSWYDKKEYTRKLSKKDIAYYKQENKVISKINVKLTNLWLKLLQCKIVIEWS